MPKRHSALICLADDLDGRFNTVVSRIAAAAGTMHDAASMVTIAREVSLQSSTVAEGGQHAAQNVQTVALALQKTNTAGT